MFDLFSFRSERRRVRRSSVSLQMMCRSLIIVSQVFDSFPIIVLSQGLTYTGFLWDSSSGVDLRDAAVLEPPVVNGNGNNSSPGVYLAHFSVRNIDSQIRLFAQTLNDPPSGVALVAVAVVHVRRDEPADF